MHKPRTGVGNVSFPTFPVWPKVKVGNEDVPLPFEGLALVAGNFASLLVALQGASGYHQGSRGSAYANGGFLTCWYKRATEQTIFLIL